MIIPVTIEGDKIKIKATESSNAALLVQWALSIYTHESIKGRKFLIRAFTQLHPHPFMQDYDWGVVLHRLFSGEIPYSVEGEDVVMSNEKKTIICPLCGREHVPYVGDDMSDIIKAVSTGKPCCEYCNEESD